MESSEPVYRALLSVDVANSGSRDTEGSLRLRAALLTSLIEAFRAAGIDWERCVVEDRGDGVIVHVPPEFPKPRLINPVLNHLSDSLRHHNRYAGPNDQVRVRAAVHAGDLRADVHGLTGTPKVLLGRLLDSTPLRQALADAPPTATVALIVSESIWDDVVSQGARGLDPDLFTQVTVRAKETVARAWITVIGHGAPTISGTRSEPSPPDRTPASPVVHNYGGININGGTVHGDVVSHKVVHGSEVRVTPTEQPKEQPSTPVDPSKWAPTSIYTTDDDGEPLKAALVRLLHAFDLEIVAELPVQRGSWFQRVWVGLRRGADSEGVQKRLRKVEQAVELQHIGRVQADIDRTKADAIAVLLGAMTAESDAVVRLGSLVLVKRSGSLSVCTISETAAAELDARADLVGDPARMLSFLDGRVDTGRPLRPELEG